MKSFWAVNGLCLCNATQRTAHSGNHGPVNVGSKYTTGVMQGMTNERLSRLALRETGPGDSLGSGALYWMLREYNYLIFLRLNFGIDTDSIHKINHASNIKYID